MNIKFKQMVLTTIVFAGLLSSCKKSETVDTKIVDSAAAQVDSLSKEVDTAVAKVDSATAKVDSAKAEVKEAVDAVKK